MTDSLDDEHVALIRSHVRTVADFPRPGVQFRDITTVLRDPALWRMTIDRMCARVYPWRPDAVVGLESRGFILGATMAYHLGLGFVPVRRPGRLPSDVHTVQYELEYGSDALEIHADAIGPGHRVVIVDDLLATGGTAAAAVDLVTTCGADVVGLAFLIELLDLRGRAKLPDLVPIDVLLSY